MFPLLAALFLFELAAHFVAPAFHAGFGLFRVKERARIVLGSEARRRIELTAPAPGARGGYRFALGPLFPRGWAGQQGLAHVDLGGQRLSGRLRARLFILYFGMACFRVEARSEGDALELRARWTPVPMLSVLWLGILLFARFAGRGSLGLLFGAALVIAFWSLPVLMVGPRVEAAVRELFAELGRRLQGSEPPSSAPPQLTAH